jgi:4-amino-4-deoxy-L-arabinose transferase-like glycosyltransferase
MALKRNESIKIGLLLLIITIAFFFRFWRLEDIPPGLYPDEAINANEALESLRTGNFKVFYPENNGREGLYMWLIGISFSIFGTSIWSLKIISATFGVLTVLGLYLLIKELFSLTTNYRLKATNIALLSSFFLAVSFWHINFSRIAFRAILLPFMMVFSFYFLFKGLRTKKILNFVTAGVVFGLGFYTYGSFRMAVLLLAVILLLFLFPYKKQGVEKKYLFFISCFLFLILLTALPIGIYFLQNPENFFGRVSQISVFSAKNPIKELIKSLILHLGMFNFYGDGNWRHNLPGSPQLFWPIGILFLMGIFISIKELMKSIKEKNDSLIILHSSLLSWLFIMLLPGILTQEAIPHSLRIIGTIPVAYIFSALGGIELYNWIQNKLGNKKSFTFLCYFFFVFIFLLQFNKYFIEWGSNPETKNAFSRNFITIGNYLNSLPPETQKIVIVNAPGVPVPFPDGIPMSAQTVMFVENIKYGKTQSVYLLPKEIDKIKINKKQTIIIPMVYEKELFQKIQNIFPQGKVENKNNILIYQI